MTHSLTFDAIFEAAPGPKWQARWHRSWPAYEAWFVARGGDAGPDRKTCEAALKTHMPELVDTHSTLTRLAGDSDRAAKFLAAWCPPAYLGGCSLAAKADDAHVRLVRNYDLSPDLNEGLLLHSDWTGTPVMGMVEFLWGLSDGINAHGLCVALAYGGGRRVGAGFGICLILRYVLETCTDVPAALRALARVPSHMDYNIVLADAAGRVASVEIYAGGGIQQRPKALATNHQHDGLQPDRPTFTRTFERHDQLNTLLCDNVDALQLAPAFRKAPLFQTDYGNGFGTLFTAEYDPKNTAMVLHWPDQSWPQRLDNFTEGSRDISYDATSATNAHWIDAIRPILGDAADAFDGPIADVDWQAFGAACAAAYATSDTPDAG